jgi:hypothetical protein
MLLALFPAAFAVSGGEETSDWPAVLGLYAAQGGAPGDPFCSGTLIAPDAVLTCAHCVDRMNEHLAGNAAISVISGTSARGGIDAFASVAEAVLHPAWIPGMEVDSDGGTDLAVLRLTAPFDGLEPVPMNTDRLDATWLGRELELVGWGATTDDQVDGGVKRHAYVPVTDLPDPFVETGSAGLGINACYGDSGGAVLYEGEIIGVPAVIWWTEGTPDGCVGGWAWQLRTDLRMAFVEETLAAWADVPPPAEPAPPAEDPGGCATVPGSAGWALGLALWACRRAERGRVSRMGTGAGSSCGSGGRRRGSASE